MSGRWVEVTDEREVRAFWSTPGILAIVAVGLLVAVIIAGIVISQRDSRGIINDVTIADLRADPDRYDQRMLELTGTVESVRTIPILEQYGIYDFRDETGSMLVLTRRGAPPGDGQQVRLTATFNSAVTLDEQIKRIVEEELGSIVGGIVDQIIPGLPLNVVYLNHERYEVLDGTPQTGFLNVEGSFRQSS